jgi:hypothetical protein
MPRCTAGFEFKEYSVGQVTRYKIDFRKDRGDEFEPVGKEPATDMGSVKDFDTFQQASDFTARLERGIHSTTTRLDITTTRVSYGDRNYVYAVCNGMSREQKQSRGRSRTERLGCTECPYYKS